MTDVKIFTLDLGPEYENRRRDAPQAEKEKQVQLQEKAEQIRSRLLLELAKRGSE